MEEVKTKPIAFIICTGLGHVNRGYESFTKECYEALKGNTEFNLFLLKGGGKTNKCEIKISCIKRNSKVANLFCKLFKIEKYKLEQATFLLGMIPALIKFKPSVIFYNDFILGTYLWHLRKILKFKYKLLFSNGAPNGAPYKTEDHVQQLLPIYLNDALEKGEPLSKQTLLPYGFNIDVTERLIALTQKDNIRMALGITPDQKLIISVGAINKYHKRMDYIIDEISKLPSNYFLVILGQFESETEELINLANNKLPKRHFIATLPYEKIKDYYIAADYFVLASLKEGFGRVLIEALSYGLPCIAHQNLIFQQVLGSCGIYINMEKENELSSFLYEDKIQIEPKVNMNYAYNYYSWDKLKSKYLSMISNLVTSN